MFTLVTVPGDSKALMAIYKAMIPIMKTYRRVHYLPIVMEQIISWNSMSSDLRKAMEGLQFSSASGRSWVASDRSHEFCHKLLRCMAPKPSLESVILTASRLNSMFEAQELLEKQLSLPTRYYKVVEYGRELYFVVFYNRLAATSAEFALARRCIDTLAFNLPCKRREACLLLPVFIHGTSGEERPDLDYVIRARDCWITFTEIPATDDERSRQYWFDGMNRQKRFEAVYDEAILDIISNFANKFWLQIPGFFQVRVLPLLPLISSKKSTT